MISTLGGWLQNFGGEARRRGKGNARRRPRGSLGSVDEVPEDFAPLFNREQDELDLSTITPMLSNRPPMTWPAYCEKFSEAFEGGLHWISEDVCSLPEHSKSPPE